jgi:hypothetical protein
MIAESLTLSTIQIMQPHYCPHALAVRGRGVLRSRTGWCIKRLSLDRKMMAGTYVASQKCRNDRGEQAHMTWKQTMDAVELLDSASVNLDEFGRLTARYGSLRHLQTMGES